MRGREDACIGKGMALGRRAATCRGLVRKSGYMQGQNEREREYGEEREREGRLRMQDSEGVMHAALDPLA